MDVDKNIDINDVSIIFVVKLIMVNRLAAGKLSRLTTAAADRL